MFLICFLIAGLWDDVISFWSSWPESFRKKMKKWALVDVWRLISVLLMFRLVSSSSMCEVCLSLRRKLDQRLKYPWHDFAGAVYLYLAIVDFRKKRIFQSLSMFVFVFFHLAELHHRFALTYLVFHSIMVMVMMMVGIICISWKVEWLEYFQSISGHICFWQGYANCWELHQH